LGEAEAARGEERHRCGEADPWFVPVSSARRSTHFAFSAFAFLARKVPQVQQHFRAAKFDRTLLIGLPHMHIGHLTRCRIAPEPIDKRLGSRS
jgi:hypothetical protein